MKWTIFSLLATGVVTAAAADVEAFTKKAEEVGAAATAGNIQGEDKKWLFVKGEISHLGEGEFWKAFQERDPEKVIVDYKKALEAIGVGLVVVPVPAKAGIYPEKFSAATTKMDGDLPAEDAVYPAAPFYEKLRTAGVRVVDMEPLYRAARKADDTRKLYCEQDAHWTPLAAQMAAEQVFEQIKDETWLAAVPKVPGIKVGPEETLSIRGDMVFGAYDSLPQETVSLRRAGAGTGGGEIEPLDKDEESPVLLLGDSHLQVFTEGGAQMHSKGAGFRDYLQEKLGFATTVSTNRADGIHSPRMGVYRASKKPGYWEKKKLVVWVFTVRSFTGSLVKWKDVPLQR